LERPIGQIDYSWIGCTDLMGGFDWQIGSLPGWMDECMVWDV
jgi:hypothetical protein